MTVSKICPTSTVVTHHEIPGKTSTLRIKKPLLHIPTAYLPDTTDHFLGDEGKSQIVACNYSLQHYTKQYGTSNGSPLPPKRLICKSPGSNPGNDYSGLTLRRLMSYIYIYMEHPFLMFLDHTQRRSTVGRTPLDE